MIDHISVGVRDLSSARLFYKEVLAEIGYAIIDDREATVGFGKKYSDFWINARPQKVDGGDTGMHVCLRTRSKEQVDGFHAKALELGAEDYGGPGARPQYADNYYAAFIRDVDGNVVEVVTFLDL